MKTHPILVDLQKLREIVAGLDLGQDKRWNEYIEARWLNYIEWWDSRANKAKRNYHALRMAVVIGGALIPALVGLRELNALGDYDWIFAVGSIIASLVVAICAGLESLFGFGDIWRQKRNAAEIIKSEGFCFIQLCGAYGGYKSHQDALKPFAENVEQLRSRSTSWPSGRSYQKSRHHYEGVNGARVEYFSTDRIEAVAHRGCLWGKS